MFLLGILEYIFVFGVIIQFFIKQFVIIPVGIKYFGILIVGIVKCFFIISILKF